MIIAALLLICQTPPIQGVAIPPSPEASIVFTDRGRTYRVGIETGRVYYVDAGPSPGPQPNPPAPPAPDPTIGLTDFQKAVYKAFDASVPDDKRSAAVDLRFAIEVTLSLAGGLNKPAQEIVDDLSALIRSSGIEKRLGTFKLGDLLASQGSDRETIIRSLNDVKTALGVFR